MELVTLYTTSTCPECERAARVLDALGIPYVTKAIDLDPEAQTDALMLKIVTYLYSLIFRMPFFFISSLIDFIATDTAWFLQLFDQAIFGRI